MTAITALSIPLLGVAGFSLHQGGDARARGTAQSGQTSGTDVSSGPTGPVDCSAGCVPRAVYDAALAKSAKRLKGWQAMERQRNRFKAALLAKPSVSEAINLACVVYGHCAELWRKARCESHLNPNARNGSEASGLFQFLPSTWRSTPFGGFSIWSPYANALAAGWMHARGRGGEWACR